MRQIFRAALILLPVVVLALSGCGGSSSGNANPFTSGSGDPTMPTGTGTVLSYNLALSVTPTNGTGTTVGPNSTVVATATLADSKGSPIANQPVKFEAVLGPVTIGTPIVNSDSSGKSINFLVAGGTTSSGEDVIVKASTTVNGQLVTSVAIFHILRSETNIIKFLTTKNPTDPDGTLNTLKVTLDAVALPSLPRTILQLVPFQILDNNGVPRARVPVTVSIYSEIGNCPVFIDSPATEATAMTVTTDDAGMGIFNAGVTVTVPEMGSENSCSVIYKAVAADPNSTNNSATIFSYGGFIATLENTKPN